MLSEKDDRYFEIKLNMINIYVFKKLEKTKLAMKEILDKYDKSQEKAKQKQAEVESKEKRFLGSFEDKSTHTIRPCLEEFATMLEERSHKCEIDQAFYSTESLEEITTSPDKVKDPKIYMRVFPDGIDFGRGADIPEIGFHAVPYEQKVETRISTMVPGRRGVGKNLGKFSIDEITTETIKREISTFLGAVFENATPPI